MALTHVIRKNLAKSVLLQQSRLMSGDVDLTVRLRPTGPEEDREVVGHGINGMPQYIDSVTLPLPAIRYKRPTPDVQALREKDEQDWNTLSIEEKKQIYRASFCQTYAEMLAPNGSWKRVMGGTLIMISFATWCFLGLKYFIMPPLPSTLSEEKKLEQLERMIAVRENPITGIASTYDYEKGEFKK